nr:formin-E isoform X3 [Ipomoea batatas]
MLCSIPTQKSGSSKWLDRLRSSKGFPPGDYLNLEQFLRQTSPNPPAAPINTTTKLGQTNLASVSCSEKQQALETPVDPAGGKEIFNAFTNVLSELFNMGESGNCPAQKKGPRKQINPRFFAASTSSELNNVSGSGDDRGKDKSASPMSDDQSRVEMKLLEQSEEEEEKIDANLFGFSRSEVTVIDTSCAPWKCDKLLFRKKNVWKVRDKRSKTTIHLGKKKKRKANEDGNFGGIKKQKVSSGEETKIPNIIESVSVRVKGQEQKGKERKGKGNLKFRFQKGENKGPWCSLLQERFLAQLLDLLGEKGLQPGNKFEEGCKKTLDSVGQTLEKNHKDL